MVQQLHEWHEFYLLLGTAAATLLALLFVAISLGAGFLSPKRKAATRAFFSPVVIHFGAVFFVSAANLVPGHAIGFFVGMIVATAAVGLPVALYVTSSIVRHGWTNLLEDYLCYGMLPAAGYLALLAAAAMIWNGHEMAFDVLAGGLLLLLLVNVRNAWDLTISMIHHQADKRRR